MIVSNVTKYSIMITFTQNISGRLFAPTILSSDLDEETTEWLNTELGQNIVVGTAESSAFRTPSWLLWFHVVTVRSLSFDDVSRC